ncbi:MAG: bifunctional glutamate N-acetyltransferase/amino-acid acetyltransferase ArgJ [Alphaproteobacteria bacterium]
MALTRSPLAPKSIIALPPIAGVRVATTAAGVRYQGRDDVTLFVFDRPASFAGVFTLSATAAPSVKHSRRVAAGGTVRAISIVAGNANVFTGKAGYDAVDAIAGDLAHHLKCSPHQIAHSATGIIGEPFPANRILPHHDDLIARAKPDGWDAVSDAIATTDTYPKRATHQVRLSSGATVTLNGIAKGSGMIKPNMATMLSYIVTDGDIPAEVLQPMLTRAADQTFNCISVDTDTSTSDSLMVAATGVVPMAVQDYDAFEAALTHLCQDLALQIIRDGEGARKLITVTVTGAASPNDAKAVAMAVAESPLVKTAIAAEDANWGRIVAAIGKSGVPLDPARLTVQLGGHPLVVSEGRITPFDESPFAQHLKEDEIRIAIDLGMGSARGHAWGCDLTHAYIDINASYRS